MEKVSTPVSTTKKNRIPLLTLIFGLIIPIVIVVAIVIAFFPFSFVLPSESENNKQANLLIPSTVLNNKAKYNQQTIVVRGKLSIDPVVCQKIQCPANDSCCGCPVSRNISLKDPDQTLTSQTSGSFQLVNNSGTSICQRKINSCDYSCQDWNNGMVYDISGQFFAQAPPPGWNMSLDYYFVVTGKNLTSSDQLSSGLTNFISGIKQLYEQITSSSGYVLN